MATMLLKDKLDKGLIKVGDYIGFQPDYAECTLQPEETGWKEKQILHTEADMKWQLVCMDSQMALLADAKTNQRIWLEGKIGYYKGVKALQKYAQTCWSSKKFRATGIIITKEQFKKLPIFLQTYVEGVYWLGSTFIYNIHYTNFGVRVVDTGGYVYYNGLFTDDGRFQYSTYGVRPAVILQHDIRIDDDNSLVPFDEAEEGTSTEEDKMSAQAQNSDAKKQLEVMIVEQEKKLAQQQSQFNKYISQQQKKFNNYIADQKEILEKMKALLSKL